MIETSTGHKTNFRGSQLSWSSHPTIPTTSLSKSSGNRSIEKGWDRVAYIATSYGLDCPGFDYRHRQDIYIYIYVFPKSFWLSLRPTHPPIQWVPDFVPEVERLEREFDHSYPSCAKVKNDGSIYLTSLCASMRRPGASLTLNYSEDSHNQSVAPT